MPTDSRPPELHELWLGEADLVYCFDFSDEPAVAAGASIASCTVTPDLARYVTAAGAAVLTEDFTQYDENGNVVGTVPAGKGVKVLLTTVAKGQTPVRCQIVCSDGQRPMVTANFVVK